MTVPAAVLRRIVVFFALSAALAALVAPAASADPFTVTKTADTADGTCDADCSLREAISAANATVAADTITLPAGHYTLTIAPVGADDNATGDLDVANNGALTISGAGARTTVIDGNATDRVIHVLAGATLSASGLTVTNGRVGTGVHGGGISNNGSLTLADAAVRGNVSGGAVACATGTEGVGGGIHNEGPSATSLVLDRVAVTGNQTACFGAGIDLDVGTATITNSTIAGNSVPTPGADGLGVGVDIDTPDAVQFVNDTIAFNTVTAPGSDQGGGIWRNPANPLTFKNTIVAANTGSNCNTAVGGVPVGPTAVSSPNLDGDSTCFSGAGAMHSASPGLAPLADNGGQTDTVALLEGSPAIDAGADCPPTDQRGVARPQRAACDLGAFELEPAATPTPTPTIPSNRFTFGKVKRNLKKGTATLTVNLPGPGQVSLTGKGVKPVARVGGASAPGRAVAGAGPLKLPVRPKGKTKVKLSRTGKAKVKVTVTFTPTDGSSNSQSKTIKLKKRL